MDVFIARDIDENLRNSFNFTINLSTYIECYFRDLNYGEGLDSLAFGIICKSVLTDMSLEKVLRKKYYKKRKEVEYDIYFVYQTVVDTTSQAELQALVIDGILNSLDTTFIELKVKDFDVEAFKTELQKAFDLVSPDFTVVFGDLSGIVRPQKIKIFDEFIQKHANQTPPAANLPIDETTLANSTVQQQAPVSMNADLFWDLIKKTKVKAGGDQEQHEALLIEELSRLPYQDIGTFDAIFRYYHEMANQRKLVTAAGIIEGFLSDDSFEYFCAWLIGEGWTIYKNALANPDSLADVEIDGYADFEGLMTVAMRATIKKHEMDGVDYWNIYGQPDEYELDGEQVTDVLRGLSIDPNIANEKFGRFPDSQEEAISLARQTKAFPRLVAKYSQLL